MTAMVWNQLEKGKKKTGDTRLFNFTLGYQDTSAWWTNAVDKDETVLYTSICKKLGLDFYKGVEDEARVCRVTNLSSPPSDFDFDLKFHLSNIFYERLKSFSVSSKMGPFGSSPRRTVRSSAGLSCSNEWSEKSS